METVLQSVKECCICQTTLNLESHHCLHGTANRKKAEKYGLKVWLCNYHHTGSNESVHRDNEMDLFFKRNAQLYYEEHIGTRQQFIKEFGKSFL